MPRKTKLPNARVATGLIEEKPGVPVYSPLVMEERDKLLTILSEPAFIKAWKNAETVAPSLFPPTTGHFDGEHGDNNAAKALARRQGWEMHKAALVRQAQEPVPRKTGTTEAYPESGTLESEIKQSLPTKSK